MPSSFIVIYEKELVLHISMLKLGGILATYITFVSDSTVVSFRSDKYKMKCADPPTK